MLYNFDKLTFQILSVGNFIHTNGSFNVKKRPFAALSFRIKGTGNFSTQGITFTSSPGDILFIPNDTDYSVCYSDGESIVVHLTDCNYKHAENFSLKNPSVFQTLFKKLAENKNQKINSSKSIVYNILQMLENEKKFDYSDIELQKCLSFAEQNFTNPNFSVTELADFLHVSESTLRRKFLKALNTSPKQYILNLRLAKAMTLLTESKLNIQAISHNCGFSDEKYFSRIIKKKYGAPPSAFYHEKQL